MASSPLLTATAGVDGWPEFHLGPWLIRPSTVLRRRRREIARVFFLVPPPDFAGNARLSVTDGRRREEFFHVWRDDRRTTETDRASGPGDRDVSEQAVRWPMTFTARLISSHGHVQADLLLETEPLSDRPLSGTLALPPLRWDASMLKLLPLVLPRALAEEPGAAEDAVAAALRAAAHDPTLRLAISGEWADTLPASGLAGLARDLAGQGRLELLWTAGAQAAALRDLQLTFPAQVGLVLGNDAPHRPGPELLAVLQLPHAGLPSCGPGHAGRPEWAADSLGNYLFLCARHWIRGPLLDRHREALAYAVCDRALRGAVPVETPRPDDPLTGLLMSLPPGSQAAAPDPRLPGRQQTLACLPLCLERAEDWRRLGAQIRRWNRRHASPRLQAVTPADYFSLIEQLHGEGLIRLAGLAAPV